MQLHNLTEVDDLEIQRWLLTTIPNLTAHQKEEIKINEIVRFSKYKFYKRREKINNIWLRLTILLVIPVCIFLTIWLPFNFIITGYWGYSKFKWLHNWIHSVGL